MSEGITTTLIIVNKLGLHTRPAAAIVKTATPFASVIKLKHKNIEADGKSILGLLTLAAGKGAKIVLSVTGPDQDAAFAAIKKLIESGFGE